MKNIEMDTQIFAYKVLGEGEIRDGGGRSEGEELIASAAMVLFDNRKALKVNKMFRDISWVRSKPVLSSA